MENKGTKITTPYHQPVQMDPDPVRTSGLTQSVIPRLNTHDSTVQKNYSSVPRAKKKIQNNSIFFVM